MNPQDWPLSRKLAASFAAMVSLTLLIGCLGMWQMSRINAATVDGLFVAQDELIALSHKGEAGMKATRHRGAECHESVDWRRS